MRLIFAVSIVGLAAACRAEELPAMEPSNFNVMLRGYCFAGSKIEDKKAPGGFGRSDNLPKPAKAPKNEVHLVAVPGDDVVFGQKYRGMKLLLINGTDATVAFPASDSRLAIIQEAKDRDGNWKPVEYLPQSWCGNSRHRVFLGPSEYWAFDAPKYEGSFKTILRFKFEKDGKTVIYSNEFAGSVNPEQFGVKQGHVPTNIMDPYLD